MLPLTGAQRRKYLAEAEKNKSLDGYVSSDPAGLKLRKLKRKEPASTTDDGMDVVESGEGNRETAAGGGTPRPKKGKASKAARLERNLFAGGSDAGDSTSAAVVDSFWHSSFDFRK